MNYQTNKLGIIICLFFVLFFPACQPAKNIPVQQPASIKWRTLAMGKIEGHSRHLPLLVDFFYGSECPRCLAVQEDVYADKEIVSRIMKDFVPVRVWINNEMTPDEALLAEELNSGGECILAFLDAEGHIIKNVKGQDISSKGMLPAQDYLQYMDEAIESLKRQH